MFRLLVVSIFSAAVCGSTVTSVANAVTPPKPALSAEEIQKIKDCAAALASGSASRYSFGSLKQFEQGFFASDVIQRRHSMLALYGNWIKKYSRLPTKEELQAYFDYLNDSNENLYADLEEQIAALPETTEILNVLGEVHPEFTAVLQGKILQQTALFLRHRMRPPSVMELASVLKVEDLDLIAALTSDKMKFWKVALASDLGRHIDYARKRIKTAYARAVRETDTPSVLRTRKIEPTLRRMVEVLILTKSNEHYQWRAMLGNYGEFKLEDENGEFSNQEFERMVTALTNELSAILGVTTLNAKNKSPYERWIMPMPVLFPGGIEELHNSTVAEYQPTFSSFEDTKNFGVAQAEILKDKITAAPGFLISEIRPGRKTNWELINGMIKFSKAKNYPIVLIPADGMFQNLDPEVVKHPDLNILTATIENRELSIRLFPNNFRKEPFSPLKEQGMYEIGQQIIIPHHTLSMETIPTAQNHMNQTKMFGTGSANMPDDIPAMGKAAKVRADIESKTIKPGFTIFEKIDRGHAQDFGGVGNHWHGRPAEFRFGEGDRPSVFVDGDTAYTIRKSTRGHKFVVETVKSGAAHIVLPDVHLVVSNPDVMEALKDLIARLYLEGRQVVLVFPDPIDSKAINAHVEKKQMNRSALAALYTSGRLNFEDEINDAIANVNVILADFPSATVVFQYSNHSDEWIQRDLINNPSWLQLIVNDRFIKEINGATALNGWTPLEYLLIHRKKYLERAVLDRADSLKDKTRFISDPSRVRTMRPGEPLPSTDADPDYRVAMQHHGHQGANGGRSSFKTHMRAEKRIVSADAHRTGYMGRGDHFWMGVGSTSYQQDYTQGGYSSWGVAAASVSTFGTMAFYDYDPYSKSFLQRSELGPLPAKEFFSEDPLKVKPPMDDDDFRRKNDSQEFLEWFKGQRRWIGVNSK